MTEILEASHFMRRVRSLLRVGQYSREQLRMMRIEVRKNEAECDWMTRPPDTWDADLPAHVGERNYAMQTLEDALKMREILFATFSGVQTAILRAYQNTAHAEPQLVMTGTVYRNDEELRTTSPAMKARLLGFRFSLTDGALDRLVPERF